LLQSASPTQWNDRRSGTQNAVSKHRDAL
jgi:hypothetical protein